MDIRAQTYALKRVALTSSFLSPIYLRLIRSSGALLKNLATLSQQNYQLRGDFLGLSKSSAAT